jgi:hypothetical protein
MATFWSFADNVYGDDRNLARYRSMDFFRFRRLFNRPAPDEMCWRVRKTWYAELFSPWVQRRGRRHAASRQAIGDRGETPEDVIAHPSLLRSFGRAPGHLRVGPQRDHSRGHPLAIDRPLARVKGMVARLARGRTFPPAPAAAAKDWRVEEGSLWGPLSWSATEILARRLFPRSRATAATKRVGAEQRTL